jgi:hypothetical protein
MDFLLAGSKSANNADADIGVLRRELHDSAGQDRIRANAGATLEYQG